MTPTSLFSNTINALLAANVAQLAAAAVKNVTLIKANFTPGAGTDIASLTPADFTGSAAKTAPSGAQQAFVDAGTGRRIVQLIEPVGGWHWVATDAVNLPQTIYGFVVTNDDDSETYGSELLPTPIEILEAGQAVDLDQVRFTLSLTPLS